MLRFSASITINISPTKLACRTNRVQSEAMAMIEAVSQLLISALKSMCTEASDRAKIASHLCASYTRSRPPKMFSIHGHRPPKIAAVAINDNAPTPQARLRVAVVSNVSVGISKTTRPKLMAITADTTCQGFVNMGVISRDTPGSTCKTLHSLFQLCVVIEVG